MAARGQKRVLVLDTSVEGAQGIASTLEPSGLKVDWASFNPRDVVDRVQLNDPDFILARADPGSAELITLLARLESAGIERLPVVLLARDGTDEPFVRAMKTGVVEILTAPFNPRLHLARLRLLSEELPMRTGRARGKGAPGELAQLVHHLMRVRRTGYLAVGENPTGQAYFVKGTLRSATYHNQTGQNALALMARTSAAWAFEEGVEGQAEPPDTSGLFDDAKSSPGFSRTALLAQAATFSQAQAQSQSLAQPAPQPRIDPMKQTAEIPMAMAQAIARTLQAAAPPPTLMPPAPSAPSMNETVDIEAVRTPILFVDDEPAVLQMVSQYFAKKGFPVSTASDGLEAAKLLLAQRFDLVLADLNMPHLDGWGLLRLMREDFRLHEIPVALFSAHDDYRESLRVLHAGAQGYFAKTLRLSALEVQVREIIGPRRRFKRLIAAGGGISQSIGALGPQWVLRTLAEVNFAGQLDCADGWGTWRAWFDAGRLVQLTVKVGGQSFAGDRALTSFLASRTSEGTLSQGGGAPNEGFARNSTEVTLQRIVPWMQEEQKRVKEENLSKARALVVDAELYRLYETVGPPATMPIARLLCESKLSPAQVIAQLKVTPADVAAVVKDLLRRGVVSTQA